MTKAVLIYNEKSGNQKFIEKLDFVVSSLKNMYNEVSSYKTKTKGHATSLARKACKNEVDLLVIVGGDGTFNECINGVMSFEKRPKIGYIPSGTCCDIANTLGISKNVDKALDNILNGSTVKMDIVKSNNLYFGYVSGAGAFIDISYTAESKRKKRIGYLAYILEGAQELLTIPKIKLEIKHDNGLEIGTYALILIINSKKVAGIDMIKKPVLDDGLVDVVLYKNISPLNSMNIGLSFLFPNATNKNLIRFKTSFLEIKCKDETVWNIDGESGEIGDQVFRVCEKAIEIIVPEKSKNRYFHNQEV